MGKRRGRRKQNTAGQLPDLGQELNSGGLSATFAEGVAVCIDNTEDETYTCIKAEPDDTEQYGHLDSGILVQQQNQTSLSMETGQLNIPVTIKKEPIDDPHLGGEPINDPDLGREPINDPDHLHPDEDIMRRNKEDIDTGTVLVTNEEQVHLRQTARENMVTIQALSDFNFELACVKTEPVDESCVYAEQQNLDEVVPPVTIIKEEVEEEEEIGDEERLSLSGLAMTGLESPTVIYNSTVRHIASVDDVYIDIPPGTSIDMQESPTPTYPTNMCNEEGEIYVRIEPENHSESGMETAFSITVNEGDSTGHKGLEGQGHIDQGQGQANNEKLCSVFNRRDIMWQLQPETETEPFPISLHENIHTREQQQQGLHVEQDKPKTRQRRKRTMSQVPVVSSTNSKRGSGKRKAQTRKGKYDAHKYTDGCLDESVKMEINIKRQKRKKKVKVSVSGDKCKYCHGWLALCAENSGVKCDKCNSIFHCKDSLKHHCDSAHQTKEVANAKEDRPYSCMYCGKQFTQKGNCKEHERIHTGEKRFRCQYCDKMFYTNSKLTQHTRIHTGEKRFKCEYCDKRFTESSKCVRHQRIHTGEKPYKCEYCQRAFSVKTNCKIHERLHTQSKPFECQLCGKRFAQNGNCKEHEKTHERKEIRKMIKRMRNNEEADLDDILENLQKKNQKTTIDSIVPE